MPIKIDGKFRIKKSFITTFRFFRIFEILIQNFNRILALCPDIPFGLYECPAPYKRILSANVFKT